VPEEALANATPYLQAFGHTVLAWLWLDVALSAQQALAATQTLRGRPFIVASSRQRAISTATSCPRRAPGWKWCARVSHFARICPMTVLPKIGATAAWLDLRRQPVAASHCACDRRRETAEYPF
jgi:hypothetical protein